MLTTPFQTMKLVIHVSKMQYILFFVHQLIMNANFAHTSLLLPFTSSFIISALLFLLQLRILIYSSSLLLASLHCGMLEIKNNIGGVTCFWTCSDFLIHKIVFFGEGLDLRSFLLFLSFFYVQFFNLR